MKQFNGSVAIVTGGGSGIGAAICRALAAQGMKVAVADIQSEAAESVAQSIRESGGTATAFLTDVTSDESVEGLAAAVKAAFGACHLVCANAGVIVFGKLEDRTWQDWNWVLSVNLFGVVRTIQAFLPMLKANAGNAHIVITSSMAGVVTAPAAGVYNASKQALMGYGETLRTELADEGVGVSLLMPGGVSTQIVNAGRNRPKSMGPSTLNMADLKLVQAAAGAQAGLADPDYAVRNLVAGIAENRTWIVTHHTAQCDQAEQRFAAIAAAFERAKR